MRRTRTRRAALLLIAMLLGSASRGAAGTVVFDVAERQMLEAADADAPISSSRAADLLLIAVLRERLAAHEITLADAVTVLPVDGDRGPTLSTHEPAEIGELLQLLLLTDSRTAAKTLAWAAGPGIGRALSRMQQVGARLGLTRTAVADDWPFAAGSTGPAGGRRGTTSARDLGRLALAVAGDAEIRRRLTLDGVPISNGGVIVRATAPLIEIRSADAESPPTGSPSPAVRMALAEQGDLELLAVATGPHAAEELTGVLQRTFQRYRRVELVREGQPIGPTVHVRGGIIPTFNAVAAEAWAFTSRETSASSLAFRLQLPSEIEAPVEVRQPLGELVVEHEGRVLAVVPLVAPQAIAPSGWLDTAHR